MPKTLPKIFFLFIFLTACGFPAAQTPTATATIVIPTITPQPPTATNTPLPSPTAIPAPERAKYILNTIINYDLHLVTVDETIIYPNHTGKSLTSLSLAIAANFWQGCFSIITIFINDAPAPYTLNGHRLDITLPTALEPESTITIKIAYTLAMPFLDQKTSQRARIFGYSESQMNMVNWYPYVAPYLNDDWVINEPWSHGEYLTYDAMDFEVNVKFTNAENPPVLASSGFLESKDEYAHYTLTAARAFALSASYGYQVATMEVDGVTLSSYYFSFYPNQGKDALQATAQAMQVFSQKFGPYPHKSLSIVMADFSDSMEFSGLYFHSYNFYNLYDGTPQSYLVAIAVHETAHQWWFDAVANNQAAQPWLDESLATYSERIFYETAYPDSINWWWSNRINFFNPQGFVDIPIYDAQGSELYRLAVYFRGALFLEELRQRIGDEAFFAFLKDYYEQGNHKVVNADDFFRILRLHTTDDFSDLTYKYFRNAY